MQVLCSLYVCCFSLKHLYLKLFWEILCRHVGTFNYNYEYNYRNVMELHTISGVGFGSKYC